jgi:hypothetical protein
VIGDLVSLEKMEGNNCLFFSRFVVLSKNERKNKKKIRKLENKITDINFGRNHRAKKENFEVVYVFYEALKLTEVDTIHLCLSVLRLYLCSWCRLRFIGTKRCKKRRMIIILLLDVFKG